MSLLKLSQPKLNFSPQKKAAEVLHSIPSRHLILSGYLFGSAVSGSFTADSDLDFLLVLKNKSDLNIIKKEVYQPRFTDIAVDWILKLESDFDQRKDLGEFASKLFITE